MFYLPNTRFVDSGEVAVAPGAQIQAEGQALVRQAANPAAGVMPSTGAAGEIFCGLAVAGVSAAPFAEPYATKVEKFVVPATGSVKLALKPVAGQFFVKGSGTPALTDKVISGLTAGEEISVTYKYALTVDQLRARQGDVQPGGYAGLQVGQIGVGKRGVAYFDQFDASCDWAAGEPIRLGANGMLTTEGTGAVVNAFVVHVPSPDYPVLGIEFSVL